MIIIQSKQNLQKIDFDFRNLKNIPIEYISKIPGVIFLVLDIKGNVSFLNKNGSEILEYKESELIGKNWFKKCLPERIKKEKSKIFQKLMRGEVESEDYVGDIIITKNRKERQIAWYNTEIHDDEGKVTRTLSFGIDITENKEIEEKLKKSEEKFKSIVNNLDVGYFRVTYDGIYLEHNPEHNRILGIDPLEDLTGSKTIDFWQNPKDPQKYLKELANNGFLKNYIIHAKKKSREKIVLQMNAHLIKNFNGEFIAIEGTFLDITYKFYLEEKSKEAEIRYHTIFEQSPDMIIIVDTETKKPIEFNDKVCKLLGYSREEFFKMKIHEYEANENQEEVKSHVERILRDGRADFETKFLTKKGEVLDIFARVRVIELLGKKYFQSICQDITERKKAEKELKRIEWLLKPKILQYQIKTPEYGDLTELNEQNMILKKVGKEVLNDIVIDYLNLLETSAAVYEKNGDYALGIFSSGWCTFLDNASRKLCNIEDNLKALNCGNWHCHESCWSKTSKKSIELGQSVENECDGGLHVFATPIWANNEIVGSINIGYGDPPSDDIKLQEIAEKYDVKLYKLKELSNSYERRPVWMTDIAKNKLLTSAKLIGEIIERKMIEQKLRESELMLQKSQEIAQIGSFEMDLSTNEVIWSNQLYKLFGLKKEGKTVDYEKVLALIHPDDRERAIKVSSEAAKERKPYRLEHRVIHPDGRILDLLITGDVIRNEKNEIVKIGGITQDITENKKKEEELRLHSAIMLNVNEGIHLVRLNDGMIVYANPAFEKMLGYNSGEMIGKDVAIVNAPTDKTPRETKEEIMGILAETGEWHGEIKNIKKDGTPFWCYANVSVFDHPEYGKVLVSVHTDITERKKAEQSLLKSQKKLSIKNKISNIFLTFPDEEMYSKILALTLKELKSEFGAFGYINENGDLVEPSLTRAIWDKCKIEKKSIIFQKKIWAQNIYGKIIKEKRSIYMNKSFKVPNGHLPILNFLGTPIIHQNEVIGIITVANKGSDYNENDVILIESIIDDITPILYVRLERDFIEKQRKASEEELKQSEVKLRERVKELKCLYGISKLIEKSDISLEQIINGTLKLIPPAWQYPDICNAKITYDEKQYTTLNFEESEWKLSSNDKINDKDLKIEVFYLENVLFLKEEELLIRDIRDRLKNILELKESERKLKILNQELEQKVEERTLDLIKSEEKVKNLINNISDVLIEIDNQGVLTFISPQIIHISEYHSKEVTGTILIDQIHFKDRALYQEFLKKALNAKDAISIECRLKHKKGYYVPISIRGSYVKIKNKNNFYGVIRDITEKRKIDTMINREIKKLKEVDRIKTDLITRMSHELKTPLISIFSGSEFLLNDYNDKLNDVVKNILIDIHAGGVRLKSMVENLLTVFEIDSKTINFRFSKENLIPIIKECIEDLIFQANKRNVLIDVELSEKIYFDVDKLMIERAISNIISNAIKNTPSDGNVFISTIEHHNYIEILIKDTGVGITKKELMDLFKPFGKIERYGKGLDVDIDGPGLGLYIANEIIKLHGGELILKCKGRNRGCTFTIRLNRIKNKSISI